MKTILEAIQYEIPMLIIPEKYDQFRLANALEARGLAETLDHKELTADTLCAKIRKILTNKDQSKLKKYSQMLKEYLHAPVEYHIRFGERFKSAWNDTQWLRPKVKPRFEYFEISFMLLNFVLIFRAVAV